MKGSLMRLVDADLIVMTLEKIKNQCPERAAELELMQKIIEATPTHKTIKLELRERNEAVAKAITEGFINGQADERARIIRII